MPALKDIKYRKGSIKFILKTLFIFLLVFNNNKVFAQSDSYEIQEGDRLQISFWEYPELNAEVTVSKDGGVALPVIGRITVAGLTIKQLREKIISQMGSYNKLITQISINVMEYGRNTVYISGQISKPGRYSFEEIPNIWDIILESGGPLETARLDNITIVRSGEDGKIITVDLADALEKGRLSELPEIYPGDTIYLPGKSDAGNIPSPFTERDEIYIVGAVGSPGAHTFEPGLNLLEVISKVGGPTPDANLKKVKYIFVSNGRTEILEIDLQNYFSQSTPPALPIVMVGNTIYIPRKKQTRPFWLFIFTTAVTTTVSILIAQALR